MIFQNALFMRVCTKQMKVQSARKVNMKRRQLIQFAGITSAYVATPRWVQAQSATTVRILAGFPPGGSTDTVSRKMADKLRGQLANNVLVENRPGAGGQIAMTTLRDSPADGNTLLVTPSAVLSIYPLTYPKLPYQMSDALPISSATFTDLAFTVGPKVPESVKSLKDFIAWTKRDASGGSYGSPGAGSIPHLIPAYLSKANNLDWRHIPYRGSPPAFQDLLGGQLAAMSSSIVDALPHYKAGKVRILATSGKTRNVFAPDVPTYREQGIPISARDWFVICMHANTSPSVQIRTAAYLQTALSQPDLVSSLAALGMEAKPSSPSVAQDLLQAEAEEWRRFIKIIGFTAES
jgi:tripartite-type tricarboxylate transporter receptor subunit TctC